jgi:hypothetical protein
LHLPEGLANLRWDVTADTIAPRRIPGENRGMPERLCAGPRFSIDRVRGSSVLRMESVEPRIWMALRGTGRLRSASSDLTFGIGDVLLIPARTHELSADCSDEIDLLEVTIPGAV